MERGTVTIATAATPGSHTENSREGNTLPCRLPATDDKVEHYSSEDGFGLVHEVESQAIQILIPASNVLTSS